jgi:hypothetical protein
MAPIPFTNQNNAPYKMGGAPPPIPPTVSETETSQELPLGRRLYWKTLRNVNDTIWETMKSGESDMLDFDDMQVVFKGPDGGMAGSGGVGGGSLAPGASTIGLGKSGTSGLLDSQLITLLEAKRAQNIGVVIARVPIEIVTERLTDLDTDGGELSVEIFERLRTVLPTDEEVACFNQYRGDTEKLRDIEKRIFKLFRLSRLSARIKFCLISLQLPTVCDELRKEIGTLRQCVSEIRSSQRLKKLLHIVLLLGNYVNHGSRGSAAGARGFSIESLSKLAEFKSQTDSGITTLHFLAARLLQNDPKIIEEIYAELVSLKPASRIATDSILATINSVKRDPDIVKHEISMYRQVYNENALVRLDRFVTETEPMIVSIMTEWNLCEQDLIDIRRFFGEDPKKLSSDDFINHLRNFIDSLISTCTDLKKRPKKFAKILATDEKERGSREGIPKMTSATNEDSLEYVSDVGPSPPVDEGISST